MWSEERARSFLQALLADGRLDEASFSHLLLADSAEAIAARVGVLHRMLAELQSESARSNETQTSHPDTTGASWVSGIAQPPQSDAAFPLSRRYDLRSELGRGGGGEVWAATDQQLRREVALKVLREEDAQERTRHRFLHEAQVTGRLSHPGIIPVHETGLLPDGRHFYAMQKILGRTLQAVLDGLRRRTPVDVSAFPLQRLLRIYAQICLTVAYAHDQGIVHRDLKPANIMLGDYGEVYVGDWGLAFDHGRRRSVRPSAEPDSGESPHPSSEERAGTIAGTLPYMAPEQIQGEVDLISPATDVYALGVLLYELLTLTVPFADSDLATMTLKITVTPPQPPRERNTERDVPEPLAELAMTALGKHPLERKQSARDLAERVTAFLDGVEEQARRTEQAKEMLERALRLNDRYHSLRWRLQEERRTVREQAETLRPSTPADIRREAWRRAQDVAERTLEAEGVYAKAVEAASRSLEHRETNEAHALLAELYWLRVEDAVRAGNSTEVLYFREQVRQHDQGRHRDRLADTGELELLVSFPAEDAVLRVNRQVALGPLLVDEPTARPAAGSVITVPVGSYVVAVTAPGRLAVQVPAIIEGNRRTRLRIRAPREFPGAEEFVYVAGGEISLGGDDGALRSLRDHVAHVEPFLIGRFPVTVEQYVRFLDAVAVSDPAQAAGHAPRSPDGSAVWLSYDPETRRFRIPVSDRDGDRWDPSWPICMVNWHDAIAYCRWRTAAEGVAFRLPTEFEWETAARGADRRTFPWGNGFDPALCRMVNSVEGRPFPAPVGTYPYDVSPYGVHDMGGLVVEWTSTPNEADQGQFMVRGGGFSSPEAWCRAATRRGNFATWNAVQIGFRVVRALPPD